MTTQHTPTPWREGDGNSIRATWPDGTEVQIAAMFHTVWSGDDRGKTRRIQAETPGNLALIIRACNSYDAMLKALQMCTEAPITARELAIARAAIAAATGG